MREVTRDQQFEPRDLPVDVKDILEQILSTGPSETELVAVALLMRIYDVNMALLSHFDKAQADEIYEEHEKGGHFNPPIFIPNIDEAEDVN